MAAPRDKLTWGYSFPHPGQNLGRSPDLIQPGSLVHSIGTDGRNTATVRRFPGFKRLTRGDRYTGAGGYRGWLSASCPMPIQDFAGLASAGNYPYDFDFTANTWTYKSCPVAWARFIEVPVGDSDNHVARGWIMKIPIADGNANTDTRYALGCDLVFVYKVNRSDWADTGNDMDVYAGWEVTRISELSNIASASANIVEEDVGCDLSWDSSKDAWLVTDKDTTPNNFVSSHVKPGDVFYVRTTGTGQAASIGPYLIREVKDEDELWVYGDPIADKTVTESGVYWHIAPIHDPDIDLDNSLGGDITEAMNLHDDVNGNWFDESVDAVVRGAEVYLVRNGEVGLVIRLYWDGSSLHPTYYRRRLGARIAARLSSTSPGAPFTGEVTELIPPEADCDGSGAATEPGFKLTLLGHYRVAYRYYDENTGRYSRISVDTETQLAGGNNSYILEVQVAYQNPANWAALDDTKVLAYAGIQANSDTYSSDASIPPTWTHVELLRTITYNVGGTYYAGSVFYVEQKLRLVKGGDTPPDDEDSVEVSCYGISTIIDEDHQANGVSVVGFSMRAGTMTDEQLVYQTPVRERFELFSLPPKGGRIGVLGDVLLFVDEGNHNATTQTTFSWTDTRETRLEAVPPLAFETRREGASDRIFRIHTVDDYAVAVGANGIYRFLHTGPYMVTNRIAGSQGSCGPHASCVAQGGVWTVSSSGIHRMDVRTGRTIVAKGLSKLVQDELHWLSETRLESGKGKISMAYDEVGNCIFILNPDLEECVVLWLTTGAITTLMDMNYDLVEEGKDIESGGKKQAHFFRSRPMIWWYAGGGSPEAKYYELTSDTDLGLCDFFQYLGLVVDTPDWYRETGSLLAQGLSTTPAAYQGTGAAHAADLQRTGTVQGVYNGAGGNPRFIAVEFTHVDAARLHLYNRSYIYFRLSDGTVKRERILRLGVDDDTTPTKVIVALEAEVAGIDTTTEYAISPLPFQVVGCGLAMNESTSSDPRKLDLLQRRVVSAVHPTWGLVSGAIPNEFDDFWVIGYRQPWVARDVTAIMCGQVPDTSTRVDFSTDSDDTCGRLSLDGHNLFVGVRNFTPDLDLELKALRVTGKRTLSQLVGS